MGYFLWLNDRIVMIKVANAIANVNDSYTVMASPPCTDDATRYGQISLNYLGASQPPSSTVLSINIIPNIRSFCYKIVLLKIIYLF